MNALVDVPERGELAQLPAVPHDREDVEARDVARHDDPLAAARDDPHDLVGPDPAPDEVAPGAALPRPGQLAGPAGGLGPSPASPKRCSRR